MHRAIQISPSFSPMTSVASSHALDRHRDADSPTTPASWRRAGRVRGNLRPIHLINDDKRMKLEGERGGWIPCKYVWLWRTILRLSQRLQMPITLQSPDKTRISISAYLLAVNPPRSHTQNIHPIYGPGPSKPACLNCLASHHCATQQS